MLVRNQVLSFSSAQDLGEETQYHQFAEQAIPVCAERRMVPYQLINAHADVHAVKQVVLKILEQFVTNLNEGPDHSPTRPSDAGTMKNLVYPVVGLLLSGCAFAPSVNVFGASFPDWLFCLAGAILTTIVIHVVLSKRRSVAWLHPLALSYPSLTTLLALLFWLGFFAH